ncbi:tetrahydromethanopterin S-methyltransferase subunit B [uncultured Methanobrevibacter sp.]|uniref:tetrahydromethanopterin S-methyltransferase subunit B n=1 Tax=uncultured Methanobrevibacter sp. TaxID=253161 RepID=UPI002612B840
MVLPLVQFIPELNLNLEPDSGVLGAGGGDLIIVSMDEINAEIAKVEVAADELMNSLDPNSAPLGSFPGREGNFVVAGKLTNMVYGFLIGVFIIIAALPLLTAMGVL